MEGDRKLAVCNLRNPLDPIVWSRTPLNICEELERRGRLGAVAFGRPHKSFYMAAASALTAAWYAQPADIRVMSLTRPLRRIQGKQILRQLEAKGATHILHLAGDRHLPLSHKPTGTKHYLYLDSTWRDWAKPRHPDGRFVRDVDRVSREAYQQMDHLFPISHYTRDSLIRDYDIPPERITVTGTGRGVIEPFDGQKDYSNGAILFVCKHGYHAKGGPLLLDAFKIARGRNPSLKLWIVGGEEMGEAERAMPGVEVFGFLPLEKLQDLFNRASLYAMPSLAEPWGLVYLEAMACRVPILGLNVNAIPELTANGQHGFIADAPTPDGVAGKIFEAFADPARLADMGERAQKFSVENFTWQRVVDTILDRVDHG